MDTAFKNPGSVLPKELTRDLKELSPTWTGLSAERRSLIRLLSRFELSREQADALYEADSRRKAGWDAADKEILGNPYRIYEISRHDPEGVGLLAVDRGVFPDDVVRNRHPLEAPSGLDSQIDIRRVRAASVQVLETAADNGHTLVPINQLVSAIADLAMSPPCPVTGDSLAAAAESMKPEIVSIPIDDKRALQLTRYQDLGDEIRKQVNGRVAGKRHSIIKDWPAIIAARFGAPKDYEEETAQQEKVAALQELASSRISVLAGPAGAGKTSMLAMLCAQSEIQADKVLLLAPTGKARVRMQELAGASGGKALTVAQFLNQHGRYDTNSGRYFISDSPKASAYGTVIIDEASMLTEDMLGALFNAFSGVKRFLLVGDPSQLPPIGAGRPFVDIVTRLRPPEYEELFPRVAPGYAELTKERRQIGNQRPDLKLARWFSGSRPGPAEDDIFDAPLDTDCLRFVEWKDADDFQDRLLAVLVDELGLEGPDDIAEFNRKLGGKDSGQYQYFNAGWGGRSGAAVAAIEDWQVLSPIRNQPYGVGSINRQVHERFRKGLVELATSRRRPIPKPFGAERIVYGDKVINLANHRRDGRKVYPADGALGYLANGEVGIAVGLFKLGAYPNVLKVEFSSQRGFTYDFYGSDFTDEGNVALELAYALTVHKAQGSQFGRVILVLPDAHPLLSRELIYTALTRHQNRVIVMHQGPRSGLKGFAAPHRSETARRMTNLMKECRMLEVPLQKGSVFLQEGLIHRTSKGLPVRSKSELIIAEALTNAKIDFEYERALVLGGQTRYPDFTIQDEIAGRTIFWEHLGMLDRADYRAGWDAKLAWYRKNGVLPVSEGDGPTGVLLVTTETNGGFDMAGVTQLIQQHLTN
ncbi:MAG: AAA family ATPase [Gemmatimonadaceae bacterium]